MTYPSLRSDFFYNRLRIATPRPGVFLTLLLICAGLPCASADPTPDNTEQLETLRQKIRATEADQSHNQQDQATLNEQLLKLRKNIDHLGAAIANLQKTSRTQHQQTEQLKTRLGTQRAQLGKHKKLLGHLARRAYLNGHQEYLKLLLNQQNPADIQRMLSYYGYLQKAHVAEITDLQNTITALKTTGEQLASTQQAAAITLAEIKQQQSVLAQTRDNQQQVLSKLVAEFHDNEFQLQKLREGEARLTQLVEQIQQALSDIPDSAGQQFSAAKGGLPWPTTGQLRHRFGQQKEQSRMRWQGVLIDAPAASEVHAAHAGRVAFADWLRGFGLLVIIDHGDDYMTVYGHNQELLLDSGSWVEQGETIALSGAGGGETEPGLYFEIRHRGKPANPEKWCQQNQ